MADRTLTMRYEDSPTTGGPRVGSPRVSLHIERSSAGRPGLYFIIRSETQRGSATEESVYIADGETFLAPVMDWLADGTVPGSDVKTPAPKDRPYAEYDSFTEYALALDPSDMDGNSYVAHSDESVDPYELRENYAPHGVIMQRTLLTGPWERWTDPDAIPEATDQKMNR